MSKQVQFVKMNGIGNKIIVADLRSYDGTVTPDAAIALAASSETHFDQLMAIGAPSENAADGNIEIFNSDGSRAGACGNGTRCVVEWLHGQQPKEAYSFAVDGNPLAATRNDNGTVTVNMGVPRFDWDQIPLSEEFADTSGIELQIGPIDAPILHTPSVANIGNPHAVFWTDKDPNSFGLDKFGPMLEHHMLFPERANISICRIDGRQELTLRTWERGAGLTDACGSAACAAAVCAMRLGRADRRVVVHLPGGDLNIEWREDNFILMTGGTEYEFSGLFDPKSGAWERTS